MIMREKRDSLFCPLSLSIFLSLSCSLAPVRMCWGQTHNAADHRAEKVTWDIYS